MPETSPKARIIDLRRRVLAGEELSDDEIRSALLALREVRESAAERHYKKKAKATLPADLNDLFK